jgi:hypothetical protein
MNKVPVASLEKTEIPNDKMHELQARLRAAEAGLLNI